MIKNLSWLFAVVFIAVGILGFVPGVTSGGLLLGIFEVDALHNLIHLASGLVFVWAALASEKTAYALFKAFGIVYAIVAVIGLVQGDTVLGLFGTNAADHVLHVVLAIVLLYVGFGMKGERKIAASAPSQPPTV